MGIRSLLPSSMVVGAKKIMMKKIKHHRQDYTRHFPSLDDGDHNNDEHSAVPKGHIAVYVLGGNVDDGEYYSTRKRLVVPVSYVNHPKFGELLDRAEAEFGGFDHPMGAITLPCDEDSFFRIFSPPRF